MRIACIGWGSLLWDPRTLPMAEAFRAFGPMLPIEFSRVSLDGRVTLVIDPSAPPLLTFSTRLAVDSLTAAVDALGEREKIVPERRAEWVGRRVRRSLAAAGAVGESGETHAVDGVIDRWLASTELDGVVWTALPARGPKGESALPDRDDLVAHLESLAGPDRARAEQYVRRTPRSVRTPHRAHFEERLGWVPSDE
jgi:hypothetical protein